jgi:hypothetical protein
MARLPFFYILSRCGYEMLEWNRACKFLESHLCSNFDRQSQECRNLRPRDRATSRIALTRRNVVRFLSYCT